MKMDETNIFTILSSGFGGFLTAIEDNPKMQLFLGILTGFSLILNILYTIFKWYKTAKKDGKITIDEVGDLVENLHDTIEGKEGDEN